MKIKTHSFSCILNKTCVTDSLALVKLTVTRAYWHKQVLPVCGEILGEILRVLRSGVQTKFPNVM